MFILALTLFPLFIIPTPWFPFQLAKVALFLVLIAASAILVALDAWRNRTLVIVRPRIMWAVLAYLGAVFVAWLLSQNPAASFIAEGTENDTLFFTVVLTAMFLLAAALFRTGEPVRTLFGALFASGVIVALLSAVQLAFGPGTLGEAVFPAASSNVVGRWNDLAVFMALVACASMLSIDLGRIRGRMFIGALVAFVLSIALLVIANLTVVWWALLGAAAAGGVLSYLYSRNAAALAPGSLLSRIPFVSVAVAVVSGVFLIWGAAISSPINAALSINELEVRPSMDATVEIMRVTYAQSTFTTLFGSGPNTFTEQWLIHKPAEVNFSAFWNLDFTAGAGAIPTMFTTLGVVGGIALLLIPLLLVMSLWTLARRIDVEPSMRAAASVSALVSLFLFGIAFVYPVSQLPFILAFALAGVHAGLVGASRVSTLSLLQAPQPISRYFGLAALVLLVAVPVATAGIAGARFLSSLYLGQALSAAGAPDLDRAEANAKRSLAIRETDDALRFLANIQVARAQAAVASTESTQEARTEGFQTAVAGAVGHARAAVALAPRDYTNWLALARIYEALIPVGVEGAYQSAQQTYVEAIRRNPRNPGLYLSAARMEGAAGSEQSLRDAVTQALTLKPNYTDAVLLIVQLEIAKNNLQGAIAASMAAVQTAPDNAGLWLQLGLLALNANAPADAAVAFERALTLIPEYANAKYFLGLTYYQLGKTAEAAGLFSELAAANPDNAEVALVLANMRAGKAPFAGSAVENPTRPANPPVPER